MDLFLVWALLIAMIVICWFLSRIISELRKIDARLRIIASLTRDTRSREGSIGIRYANGGAVPEVDRARQQGPRYDVPGTGHMRRGLKFTRKGGEYERNRDTDGD